MAKSHKNKLTLCLAACFLSLFIASTTAYSAENNSADALSLHPQSLAYVGIDKLKNIDPNLTGKGVNFAVICRSITYIDGEPQNDYRPSTTHNCFSNNKFSFNNSDEPAAGISPHSTAVCSILFGDDPNASDAQLGNFRYQGVAASAQAEIYEFWHFLTNNILSSDSIDADILTIDVGSQFEDWWTQGIESLVEHTGLIAVAGIGNGNEAYDPPLYPGASANVIGVGVIDAVDSQQLRDSLEHFALAHPAHSTAGPTEDNRCKPDIVAPGNCLVAVDSEPNLYEPSGSWSSFSNPIVAGTIGLLVQAAKQDPNLNPAIEPNGGNCVIKAILLNSATKLPYWHKGRLEKDDDHYVPLDYLQGAGLLNAVNAYMHLISKKKDVSKALIASWDNNVLQRTGNLQNVYRVTANQPKDKFITATLVWNKHYNDVYPFEPLTEKDDNLRLEVWALDANNPDNDYLLDYSDSNNDNLEHIYCLADPNCFDYEIIVTYSDTNNLPKSDVTQRYGLAWSADEKQQNNPILCYDLNADGIVDIEDFTAIADNLISAEESDNNYTLGDINSNGTIDANDFKAFIDHLNLKANWYKK